MTGKVRRSKTNVFYHCTTQPTVELHLLANVGVGCPMGELLTQLVPRGAYVRIPIANDTRRSTQCYRVCKCGGHNLLHHCRDMGCIRADQCQLNYGMIQGRPSLYYRVGGVSFSFSCE